MRSHIVVVSLPHNSEAEDIYRKAIRPITERLPRTRVVSYLDDVTERIETDIKEYIRLCNIMVCILSGNNPNVLYEVGLAQAFGKPIIPITNRPGDLPSMLKHLHAMSYQPNNITYGSLARDLLRRVEYVLEGDPDLGVDERHSTHVKGIIGAGYALDEERTAQGVDPAVDGIRAYKAQSFEKAISCLERAIKAGDQGADVFFALADSYFLLAESRLDQDEEPIRLYQEMHRVGKVGFEAFPEHRDLKKTFALACMKMGDYRTAEQLLVDLRDEHPDYEVAQYNLACLFALDNRFHACIQSLDGLFKRNYRWVRLARVDPDFDRFWDRELFQRLLFPSKRQP